MNLHRWAVLVCFATALTDTNSVRAITLQPDESASKDTFVYQFLPTFNFDSGGFGSLLTVGKTSTGHDTQALLQFDLPVGLTAAQLTSATLEVFAVSSTAAGFGQNPDATHPVLIDVLPVAGATTSWTESTVSWSTGLTAGAITSSATQAGIDQWITFDVTAVVKQWLDGSLSNNGLFLQQDAVVGGPGAFYVGVFDSSAGANRPRLNIVPEPSSMLLALLAAPFAAWCHRRRAAERKG